MTGGTFLAVGDTPYCIDEKTRSVPPHGKECPPTAGRCVPCPRPTNRGYRMRKPAAAPSFLLPSSQAFALDVARVPPQQEKEGA